MASADEIKLSSSDFGVLGYLDEVLSERGNAADGPEASLLATGALSGVEASLRDSESSDPIGEVETQIKAMASKLVRLRLKSMLSGEADANNCYVEIHIVI